MNYPVLITQQGETIAVAYDQAGIELAVQEHYVEPDIYLVGIGFMKAEFSDGMSCDLEEITIYPAPHKLSTDRVQVSEVEAPSHSLPNWSECNLRVGNSEWLKDNVREPEHDLLTANPLHEFIYEYDDSDAYKSAWFLHRLEKLIGFIRSEQQPTPEVTKLAEVLEQVIKAAPSSGPLWHGSEQIVEARAALTAHRKPKTHIVNGVEIPDLRVSPKQGDYFYLVDPLSRSLFTVREHTKKLSVEKLAVKEWVERGLVYLHTEEGKQAATLHAKAMLGIG